MYDTNESISPVMYYVEYERQEKKKIDSNNYVHDVIEENQDKIGKNSSSSMKWKKYLC
jgi:hypothetical protein